MKTWFKGIKTSRRNRKNQLPLFAEVDTNKYKCTYTDLYLGRQAIINVLAQHIEVGFSYSVKDGIIVKIKTNLPYQVLFSFCDGAYFINDRPKDKYGILITKLLELKNEKENCKLETYTQVFEKLERIMYSYIFEWY